MSIRINDAVLVRRPTMIGVRAERYDICRVFAFTDKGLIVCQNDKTNEQFLEPEPKTYRKVGTYRWFWFFGWVFYGQDAPGSDWGDK